MAHVVGIAEIVLWTADRQRAPSFYRDLLGLELISPPALRDAFLKAGEGAAGIPAMIVPVPKGDDVLGQPSGYQLHHLALALPPEAFDAQHDALLAAGFTPRGGKHPVLASRTMYVDDPDGNRVQATSASVDMLSGGRAMSLFGRWRIVSSPDFDDAYLRMEVEPYVELRQEGKRVSGEYQAGLQQGDLDGRLEGEDRVVFSFEGMDEMDEVHGRGTLQVDGAQARFVLEYYQGDTFTFICEGPTG